MAFKPFYRFVYNDSVFVKNNVNKLIPGGRELTEFHEEEFENVDPDVVRAAILLASDGLPPFVEEITEPLYDNAIEHLNYFMSDCVSDVLFEGMSYGTSDFEKWRILLITVMLSRWFAEGVGLKILLHTPRGLSPIGILKIPEIATQFENGNLSNMVKKYFDREGLDINKSIRLLSKVRLFGYSSEFFKVFNPHSHILYGPAMDAITKYSSCNTKEGDKLAATLMTLYFPQSSIDAALKS